MEDLILIKNTILSRLRKFAAEGGAECFDCGVTEQQFKLVYPCGIAEAIEDAMARWPQMPMLKDMLEIAFRHESPRHLEDSAHVAAATAATESLGEDCMYVRRIRLSKGLKQATVAKVLNFHPSAISRMESGQIPVNRRLLDLMKDLESGKVEYKPRAVEPTAPAAPAAVAPAAPAPVAPAAAAPDEWFGVFYERYSHVDGRTSTFMIFAAPSQRTAALYRGHLPSQIPTSIVRTTLEAVQLSLGDDFANQMIKE